MRHKKQNGAAHHGDRHGANNHHQKPDANAHGNANANNANAGGKKKKRKTNTLGLTPGDDSADEEYDEEAKLVEMIGPDAPNPDDIAAWIAERRQNFPTAARRKAKLAEAGEDKAVKAEGAASSNNGNASKTMTALERQQQKAEKLRKQLEKVESSIKRKREQQDEGDEMRDVDAVSEEEDSDTAPEAAPIRSAKAADKEKDKKMPPAAKKADPTKHCKYYSTGGTCGKKGKCRFVHDPAVREAALQERERNGGRMTLQQRLTLNDKDQEDLTIVKTLQYLKEKGAMKDGAEDAVDGETGSKSAPLPSNSTLPANPSLPTNPTLPNLPANPNLPAAPAGPPPSALDIAASGGQPVRYQGWNLSGFGNTGVKDDA